jgi:iron complex outermembrane receptor protein
MKTLGGLALLTPFLVCLATEASAQDAGGRTATGGEASQVGEVVVTARKRVEDVQSVAATVQVASGAQLTRSGVVVLRDLTTVAPGVNISNAPSPDQFAVSIRGLGSSPGDRSFDGSVSLFVDGVYTPLGREFAAALFDVSSLETIRGTQAALLGKNTSLGALNLITTKPGNGYEIDLQYQHEFALGSDRLEGGFNIPIGDRLKVRLSGLYDDEAGAIHNTIAGGYGPDTKTAGGRIVAVWNPVESVDVTGTYEGTKNHAVGANAEFISATPAAGQLATLAGYPGTFDPTLNYKTAIFSSNIDGAQLSNLMTRRGAVTVNWRLGGYTLTSQTGYTGSNANGNGAASYLPGNDLDLFSVDNKTQWTQEVRLASPTGPRLDYIVGAFYLDGRFRVDSATAVHYPAGVPGVIPITGTEVTDFDQHDRAYSAFGQANFRITDPFKVTAGLRYTNETKDVDFARQDLVPGLYSLLVQPPFAPFTVSKSEDSVDGSVGLNYKLPSDTLLYASWGQGTKAGGFAQSVSNLRDSEYAPEVAQTTEAGFKQQLFDRRLTVNGAAFYTTVHDFQLVTFTGIDFVVGNTDLRSIGFESSIAWAPAQGLHLFWNNTYADAQDTRVGGDIPFAPRWEGAVGGGYSRDVLGDLRASLDVDVDYRSSETSQENPGAVPRMAASTRLNLSAGLGDPAKGWEVRVIGKNLNNERVVGFEFPGPLLPAGNVVGIPLNPLTVMLQVSFKH